MKKRTFFKGAIFFAVILSLLLGCGKKNLKTTEGDPALLYREGLSRFNKRDYSEALKSFELLKSSFPDSPPYTIWAELKVGDCHFFQKEYVEAIAAYEEFKKIHPSHEEIPYVIYQIAMSYFNQVPTPDRDQTPTQKALSNFEYLVANYPPSLFTEKAVEKIDFCRKRLADHEFYVGNYYYKGGKFKAASVRFQGLIEKYPKMPEEDKILFLLGKSYLELDQEEKAKESFNKLVNEYPKSSYNKEAKELLEQGLKGKVASLQKNKAKESKKPEEEIGTEPGRVYLVKFDEEGRQAVLFTAPPPVTTVPVNPIPPKEETQLSTPLIGVPIEEDRAKAFPPPPQETKQSVEIEPDIEQRSEALPPPSPVSPTPKETPSETKTKEESQVAVLPSSPVKASEKQKPSKEVLPEQKEAELLDTGQPIDIISDRVETYSKENLIIFKGNVTARQKDVVIYSDSLEAMVIEGGKGIERVVAGGNVKIQQGIRVANCQKAVFYNIDQKMVLTGDPKVWEGENMVSGDEIVFYIEQNRIEVRGGPGGRGKAKIYTEGGFEKTK